MPTIGEQLKLAREARKLTIKQVVQAVHIRAHYLQAMESDDFPAMPSPAQARGFLRLYAEYLGLDADELIANLRADANPETTPPVPAPKPAPANLPPIAAPEPERSAPPVHPEIPIPGEEPGPAPAVSGPAPLSQKIFTEIGLAMHERRELISLTLDEIERHTHVRKHNLELIEAGNFDELPSPVQARGILSAYASFLDMDTDAVLLRYADALQLRRVERQPSDASKTTLPRARFGLPILLRRFISPDLVFGGGMILLLLALSIWGAARIFSGSAQAQNTPTQGPSISDVLLASPAAGSNAANTFPTSIGELGTSLPTLDPALVTPSDTPTATISSAVQITVVVLDRTFLRVTVDGEIKQDGRVSPGAALTFDGSQRIEVLTGSGTAVQIIFNQSSLGVMGSFGEVVDRIYTINGIETPTSTPSATPTITPKPSPTVRATSTSRPTLTPRPTSTPRPTITPTPHP